MKWITKNAPFSIHTAQKSTGQFDKWPSKLQPFSEYSEHFPSQALRKRRKKYLFYRS